MFTILMALGSLFLLWSAYGISGFEALSAPGAIPMVTAATMLICALMILRDTLRRSPVTSEKLERDILPLPVVVTIAMITAYALLLKPLGFVPTSFVFLAVMIRYLARCTLPRALLLSVVIVAVIYLVFRLVFTVLMPAGIVPEAEIIAWVKALFAGKGN
ncbi:tripartite tricarboxylate transporter TctB family protein [Frigidibacter sp.]|uniref:tripartite tricarboxylate transporter TctB family protein n=1 Tax=Frigidibacter sp. TaxID=2586418 RepID=UPI0027346359|nr:tripartite tricarboxylate transporter TctB family protein [Frigidibacter sp.]MDP3339571.1 tripartite tricarboxylate transporter TctB family protein [Frigidibacter sp.]